MRALADALKVNSALQDLELNSMLRVRFVLWSGGGWHAGCEEAGKKQAP